MKRCPLVEAGMRQRCRHVLLSQTAMVQRLGVVKVSSIEHLPSHGTVRFLGSRLAGWLVPRPLCRGDAVGRYSVLPRSHRVRSRHRHEITHR